MNQTWTEYKEGKRSMLPATGKPVIVYSPTEGMGIAARKRHFTKAEWCWLYRRVNASRLVLGVTHWMPLPDPPTSDVG